ncbi:MAG: hypothetical protein ACRCTI_02505 [Beijerinckiaceae bacterium]
MAKKTRSDVQAAVAPGLDALMLRARVNEAFGASAQELRRDGRPPLRFEGRKLAEATSFTPGTSLWYEVGAYVGRDGYVAAVKVFKKSPHEKDMHVAETFGQLPDMMTWLETYDPAHDVTVTGDLTDRRLSPAEAMVRAAALRQRMAEARSEYRAAAGDVLTELSQLAIEKPQAA